MALRGGCVNALTAYDYAFSERGTVLWTLYLQFYENLLIWWTLFVTTVIMYIHRDLQVRIRAKFSSSAQSRPCLFFPLLCWFAIHWLPCSCYQYYKEGKLGNRKIVIQLLIKRWFQHRLTVPRVRALYLGQGKAFIGLTWVWRCRRH